MGKILTTVAVFAVALLAVILLAAWGGIGWESIAAQIAGSPYWLFVACAALIALQIAISARKWQLSIEAIQPGLTRDLSYGFYLRASAVSAFLAQFVTVYFASVMVRSWALKHYQDMPVKKSAANSVYEQTFDLVAIMIFAAPTILIILFDWSLVAWFCLIALCAALAYLSLWYLDIILTRCLGFIARVPRLSALGELYKSESAAALFQTKLTFQLLGLALVRYATIAARTLLVGLIIAPAIGILDILQGFTLVQATQIAAVTPGNLGIQEWSWVGSLALFGYNPALTGTLAIALRLIGILSLAVAFAFIYVGSMRKRSE